MLPAVGGSGTARKIPSYALVRATLLRQDELARDGRAAHAVRRDARERQAARGRERAHDAFRKREAEVVVARPQDTRAEREAAEPRIELSGAAREDDEPHDAPLLRHAKRLWPVDGDRR